MEIRTVGVLGAGQMGLGIAQAAARAGLVSIMAKATPGALDAQRGKVEKQLEKDVERGKLTAADHGALLERLRWSTKLEDLASADIVIESIVEELPVKREHFARLDGIVQERAIFATNTSTLTVAEMASATKRPDRFIGLHFFNPVQMMKLLEVIRSVASSDEAFQAGVEWGKSLGKLTVETKDKAGFIVNRLLVPYMLDAIRAYEEGVGTITEIDEAMKAGAGHPMGPLTLADFVGLDTMGAICDVMFDEFRERRFSRPPTLRKMLMAGWYGRKTGMGFYDYSGDEPKENEGLANAV